MQKFVEEEEPITSPRWGKWYFWAIISVRLEKIKEKKEFEDLLKNLDYQNILSGEVKTIADPIEDLDDDELINRLGVKNEVNSITNLKHVKTRAKKRATEKIATRTICENFEEYKPLFEIAKK